MRSPRVLRVGWLAWIGAALMWVAAAPAWAQWARMTQPVPAGTAGPAAPSKAAMPVGGPTASTLPPPKAATAAPAPAAAMAAQKGAAVAPALDPAQPAAATAAMPVRPAAQAAGMPREPSIYETGRVGRMGVSESGLSIKHTQDGARPKELAVEGKTPRAEGQAAPAGPAGVMNAAVLGRELRPRLALLRDCRVEVARQKRVQPGAVLAGHLTLRWIVQTTGQVTDTQVVALSPADGRVIDCVKRQMSLWSFSPPTGGPALVERPFRFQ